MKTFHSVVNSMLFVLDGNAKRVFPSQKWLELIEKREQRIVPGLIASAVFAATNRALLQVFHEWMVGTPYKPFFLRGLPPLNFFRIAAIFRKYTGPRLAVLLPPICPARLTIRASGMGLPQCGQLSTNAE